MGTGARRSSAGFAGATWFRGEASEGGGVPLRTNGAGIGASHQTGWTGLVAKLLQQSGE